ncbi:hypothetical protein L484_008426 [Morus notabilis]|uniref:Uncharacterized protein n=1 Tax=Morus notabilis TaxID=981085 RepID=W9S8W0_9ROSA|nr:hypothetical protein L484_008426 [Morus notabilis]
MKEERRLGSTNRIEENVAVDVVVDVLGESESVRLRGFQAVKRGERYVAVLRSPHCASVLGKGHSQSSELMVMEELSRVVFCVLEFGKGLLRG